MKKLVLIDGNAILHRAFHALPPLTNKEGIVVNAVYGFFSMFLKITEDQKPDFIVVCFDKKAPTFRKELFVGYQAKRPKMSDDLIPQIKFVHEILEASKIEIFEVDGYEADDLIGTISVQAVTGKLNGGIDVYIVSGDRDLLQLVNGHVRMIAPITGLTNMIVYDSTKVIEKFGIKPSQIVDYKALVGDASDNYPGVPGIGPKTAANLINEYGSLEEIYKNLEKIKAKNPNLALKLAEGAEAAGLAQKLAGIVLDTPIKLDIKKAGIEHFDKEGLKKEFERFNFKSLLGRLSGEVAKKAKPAEPEKKSDQLSLIE
ncbi:MAG: 5'-3' exonuclease H3TH domain-containing protein [Candidatus Levybacteria bacterium]|nr:5'-3' exonuclease H3TH domain-containing protein [Candidatus Levybacteria bacterium]